jgi:hypothetical protein
MSIVKLKRSAVSNKVPLTTDLDLGELAVNTFDGKLFLKRNNGTDAIREIGAVTVEKNGTAVGTRRNINFIEGTNITLTIADDSANDEVDVTIAASGGGATNLDSLTDVVITTPSNGQVLKYNGTNWINDTDATGGGGGGLTWSRKTANYTAVNGDAIIADTSGGTFTITLPATPTTGTYIKLVDGANWGTTNLTVARNASTIEGLAENLIVNVGGIFLDLVYDGTTWEVKHNLRPDYPIGGDYIPITGGTYSGAVTVNSTLTVTSALTASSSLKAARYDETFVANGTTATLNCSVANAFSSTPSGNITYVFSSPPASGTAYSFTLKVTPSATMTITWPTSVDWAGGTAPASPASGATNIYAFFTHDGGTTWYGFLSGAAMA